MFSTISIQMKYLIIFSALFLFACGIGNKKSDNTNNDDYTTIYLVRHAEKDKGSNPPLTAEGQARAEALAEFLSDKNIKEIFSTDYIRTQQTAAPTAKKNTIDVGSYSPRELADFAQLIQKSKGTILVVGHSNTTPELAEILGADPGEPIVEAWEYDRLYELKFRKGKLVEDNILRFGVISQPK